MRRKWELVLIVSMLVAALAVSAGCGNKAKKISPTTTGSEVKIADFAFSPATVTVTAGMEITWINEDSTVHTVTGTDFDSGEIKPVQSYKHTFSSAGTYDYHCSIHPSMKGQVVVTGGGASTETVPKTPTQPTSPATPGY